jgi:Ca-activated chloride channel family protein
MRHTVVLFALMLASGSAHGRGLLIPTEKQLPPLALLNHEVAVSIEDQVAITRIEQTFRNHTSRPLEATYLFPLPKGASVRKFSMWVDGKEVPGELVEADKARKIYTDIVQRTLDPGLLEYMGNNLLRLRVFPVPAKGDQKIALSYTSIAPSENGVIEYLYPLRTEGKAASTLEKFALNVRLKSQHPITNVYSPSHAITMRRPSEREAVIGFEKSEANLDHDFQLFFQPAGKDIGLTSLLQRPDPGQPGYFLLLVAPRLELSRSQQVPRDMVFVVDTSGSMRGKRMTQACHALKYCLANLTPGDRFGVLNFATTVNRYAEQLQPATTDNLARARKWVDALESTGGTAIDDALRSALEMRESDPTRTFTVVFFTDGRPTIGETNAERILQNVAKRNSASTRIFTFGVGDDVNASMLDALADNSRAVSTYVRESEDIEAKVSGLYSKISNPVLANLKLTVGDGIHLSEIYPPQLPDLFHGSQLVVLGRYTGQGHAALRLTGSVGSETREFVYEMNFADKNAGDKTFVEDLWARRKVGYLLDQIRVNGEKKELVDEVVTLAKRYGITTPYTSYLMVPDNVAMPAPHGRPVFRGANVNGPAALALPGGVGGGAPAQPLAEFARGLDDAKKDLPALRDRLERENLNRTEKAAEAKGETTLSAAIREQRAKQSTLDQVHLYFGRRQLESVQTGKLGVDFALQNNALRNQTQLTYAAARNVQKRNVVEIGGVWIDDGFDAKMETVAIKAMSPAYFRILERQPQISDVYRLGNFVVWVAPSGKALIIDQNAGREELPDTEIDQLFTAAKK